MKYIIDMLMTLFSLWRWSSDSHSVPEWWLPVQTSPVWTSARSFVCWRLLEGIKHIENMKVVYIWQKHLCHEELYCLRVDSKFHEGKRRHEKSFRDQDEKKKTMWEEMRTNSGWRCRRDKHDVRWKLEDEGGEQTKKRRQRGRGSAEKGSKVEKEGKKTKGMTSYKSEQWSWGWKQRKQRRKDVKTATNKSKTKRRNRRDENEERDHK